VFILTRSRRQKVGFDREENEADHFGDERSVRKRIPNNKTNLECILVMRRFDAGAIVEIAGGVFANNANPPGRERPPTQGQFSNNALH